MKIVGHRGARGLAPENTLASLQKALEHHADMIEFDVQTTKDAIPVLHHDPDLTDPGGRRMTINQHNLTELKQHKADLPTLVEAFESINRQVPLYIEVKPEADISPIIKVIKEYVDRGWQPEDFRLASFSQAKLKELQEALPEITKTVLERWSGVRATRRARQLNTQHILMNQRWLWWGFIRSVTRGGYKLGAYTVNDPAKAARWEKHGLRLIMTDFPDRFEKS